MLPVLTIRIAIQILPLTTIQSLESDTCQGSHASILALTPRGNSAYLNMADGSFTDDMGSLQIKYCSFQYPYKFSPAR